MTKNQLEMVNRQLAIEERVSNLEQVVAYAKVKIEQLEKKLAQMQEDFKRESEE